jgi:hypothetical protein
MSDHTLSPPTWCPRPQDGGISRVCMCVLLGSNFKLILALWGRVNEVRMDGSLGTCAVTTEGTDGGAAVYVVLWRRFAEGGAVAEGPGAFTTNVDLLWRPSAKIRIF